MLKKNFISCVISIIPRGYSIFMLYRIYCNGGHFDSYGFHTIIVINSFLHRDILFLLQDLLIEELLLTLEYPVIRILIKRYQLTKTQLIKISTPYKLTLLVMRMYNKQLLLFMRL